MYFSPPPPIVDILVSNHLLSCPVLPKQSPRCYSRNSSSWCWWRPTSGSSSSPAAPAVEHSHSYANTRESTWTVRRAPVQVERLRKRTIIIFRYTS